MTVKELKDFLNKQDDRLKISFLVANIRSNNRVSALVEDIEVDEEDCRVFFLLRKTM